MSERKKLLKLILSALFLALCYTLPFLTGQLQQLGNMLTPMHFPVLLCGFICGWSWGLAVGLVAPLLRALTIGMPLLFPHAVAMAFELGTYGAIAGLTYAVLPRKKLLLYPALLAAMLAGRLVYGGAMLLILGLGEGGYTWGAFLSAAVLRALPGILLQLLLIPPLVLLLERIKPKALRC